MITIDLNLSSKKAKYNKIAMASSKCNCGACSCNCGGGSAGGGGKKCSKQETIRLTEVLKDIYS